MLLFLKNVQKIALYEWLPGASEPAKFFETGVVNMTPQLRDQRNYVLTAVAAAAAAAATKDAQGLDFGCQACDYPLQIMSAVPGEEPAARATRTTWTIWTTWRRGRRS